MGTKILIQSQGTQLTMLNNQLLIKNEHVSKLYSLEEVKEITIATKCSISSQVFFESFEKGVLIYFLDNFGHIVGKTWSGKSGSISTIRKNQAHFSNSNESVILATNWIKRKILGQINCLNYLTLKTEKNQFNPTSSLYSCIHEIEAVLQFNEFIYPEDIRKIEAKAAKNYFKTLNTFLPQEIKFPKRTHQPAEDLFNAALNYLYGMLYKEIESALISVGLDPTIGFFHRNEYNTKSLVFDAIEPFRPWAELVLSNLCIDSIIGLEHQEPTENGISINSLGKRILVTTFQVYLDEVIAQNGLERSRKTHLKLEFEQLANSLK